MERISQFSWRFSPDEAPEDGTIARGVVADADPRFPETPQDRDGSGSGGSFKRRKQPAGIGSAGAVQNIRERKARVASRRFPFQEADGIRALKPDIRPLNILPFRLGAAKEIGEERILPVWMEGYAAFDAAPHHGSGLGWQAIEELRGIGCSKGAKREQDIDGRAERPGVQVLPPVSDLRGGIFKLEKPGNFEAAPSEERADFSEHSQHTLSHANFGAATGKTPFRVGKHQKKGLHGSAGLGHEAAQNPDGKSNLRDPKSLKRDGTERIASDTEST